MSHERSILFVPGSDADAIDAATRSGADGLILDLEDTVSPANKAAAREVTLDALSSWADDDPTPFVRVNGLDTTEGVADLEAVVANDAAPEAVVLPDVRGPTDVRIVADRLDDAGSDVGVVPIVERPDALFAVDAIAAADRVSALAFGSVDFRLNAGMSILDDDVDVTIPKYLVSLAASAAGVRAFDTVYLDRSDPDGLRAAAREARAMGYDAKMAIHEDQIEPIAEAFAPSEAERDRARRLVEQFEATDEGVVYFEGSFVDKPVVDQQRELLERGGE
ncbi:HpcH/HpaI aldolase/citrate lyase family protein [Halorussus halobius]|uniref:HpcH/HpaI aldolase/citrate lyase family protein n=1 Tax=Halorussus halobius TaxID=1710537 RepID=UPI0010932C72|nr:CoA ester lyase [Halorussus halobius]